MPFLCFVRYIYPRKSFMRHMTVYNHSYAPYKIQNLQRMPDLSSAWSHPDCEHHSWTSDSLQSYAHSLKDCMFIHLNRTPDYLPASQHPALVNTILAPSTGIGVTRTKAWHKQEHIQIRKYKDMHTCTHSPILLHTQTHTGTHEQAHIHTRTHTLAHTRTHTHSHTHKHTYTHMSHPPTYANAHLLSK
jgi:hypothetical protein